MKNPVNQYPIIIFSSSIHGEQGATASVRPYRLRFGIFRPEMSNIVIIPKIRDRHAYIQIVYGSYDLMIFW